MNFIILLTMIFLHIVDDFYLQGSLGKYKQKEWWINNYPDKMYSFDYITCLFIHAFSWTFVMCLPITIGLVFSLEYIKCDYFDYILFFIFNVIIHFVIDNAKANWKIMSLTEDQCMHILQIFCTWLVCIGGI